MCASSLPLAAGGGHAGWRRAGVIPTDRGSREEEPEVIAGGSGPGVGRARGGSGRGRFQKVGGLGARGGGGV